MEQTKGYWRLEGKIWGLNNKKPFENSVKRNLSFGIQSSRTNTNYVQVGDWKNSKLNVKVKVNKDEEVKELSEQDAIDFIKENFKDGDSVYLNVRSDVDTYHKRLNFIVSQIYKKSEPIDFDLEDFTEVNELKQSIVITEKPSDEKLKVGVSKYKGEMVEVELNLSDEDVKDYFLENAKSGDFMNVFIKINNKPIYEDGKGNDNSELDIKTTKTLKGRVVEQGTKKNKFRKITGHDLSFDVIDVDIEKTESKKYTREEIREALEIANVEPKKSNNDTVVIDDDDMPF